MSLAAAPPPTHPIPEPLRRIDLRVVVPALALVLVGLVSIGSDRPELVLVQVRWAVIGIGLMAAVQLVPFRRLLDLAFPLYLISLVLLVIVLVPGIGTRVNGAQRWLRMGGVSFQPSELAKVTLVLALARYVRFRRDHRTLKGLVAPFLITLVPMLLILKEPDLGTALMMVPILFAMLWVSGARTRHLGTVVLLGIASLPLLYQALPDGNYQKKRVDGFIAAITPNTDLAAVKAVDTYHLQESLAAVAGGGLSGQGWRRGKQNRMDRVPESWTDFVFAVHAEEWGFGGAAALLLVEASLLLGLALLARDVREPGGRLIVVGTMVLFGTQCCVNLGMTVGLAPITGLPLPFVSYGGSAMLTAWLLLGLALNARTREPVVFSGADFE